MSNVVSLNLSNSGLSGYLGRQIGIMKHLKVLDLTGNGISGPVPISIGNCTKLEELLVLHNRLSGSLPDTLSNIEALRVFDITNFTGKVNFRFENCKLEKFILSYNNLRGEVPSWIWNCSSLTQLAIVNNGMTGQIPSSVVLLTNLSYLVLSQNSLSGTIPPEIDANQLEGTVPKELANLRNLQLLYLFENRLTGEFPEEIWGIQSLESVGIYKNNFTGKLPLVLAELKHLQQITLYNNFDSGIDHATFVGTIPPKICSGRRLKVLYLGLNLLNGSIPSGIADYPTLERGLFRRPLLWLRLYNPLMFVTVGVAYCYLPERQNGTANMALSGYFLQLGPVVFLSSDGLALLDLSKTLILPSSISSNWSSDDATPCTWKGVGCDEMSNLVSLNLSHSGLSGSLGPQIGLLKHLKVLDLTGNGISGPMPISIGNCTKLEELLLLQNRLSGSLPDTLSNIEALKVFDITNNSFTGEVNFRFENCKLEKFILSYNNLRCEVPSWIWNCSSLTQFAIVNNGMTGQIPSSNSLSGTIPPEIGNCQLLIWLHLDANQIEGTVPKKLANLRNLQLLYLFENRLTGEFPEDIWGIESLLSIDIYSNNLTGQLPLLLAEMKQLKQITLFNNSFTGVIPQGLGINSSLSVIDFINNSFVGTIPPKICSGGRLGTLNLGLNLLNGSIPSGIADCPTLKRVILKQNNLIGPIPQFISCSNLDHIDLSYNFLSGDIPASLSKCSNVTFVNWSRNKLTGQIPPEIGKLAKLRSLNLSVNRLNGEVPVEISGCSKLYQLDLGYNSLNGSALTTVSSLKFLSQLRLQENKFSGGLPDSLSQLDMLIELQLGGNILRGSIPSSLGTLNKLSIALNLSRNGLIGGIPPQLSNLVELQSLDLSFNNLTGGLGSLGKLQFLYFLNVSYNMFNGPVPKNLVRFLNSTLSSFSGNPDLCMACNDSNSSCTGANVLKPCDSLRKKSALTPLKVAMIVIGSLFVGALLILCVLVKYNFKPKISSDLSILFEGPSSKLNEAIEVTENFSSKYIIGSGAHGTVYKAVLRSGEVYAVKKLLHAAHKGSNASMIRELQTLGRIRHRNLIKLEGFLFKSEYGLILYDFMENGSLHDVLHGTESTPTLDWSIRYNIALGTAHGLAYLHNDCHPAIIHRDIKPKNILLDNDMVPHISDFGIAKLMDQYSATSQTTGIVGTTGYMAPEMAFSTRSTMEFDVYSYGVVLLELITRKMAVDSSFPGNMDIVSWVSSQLNETNQIETLCDPALMKEVYGTYEMEELRKVLSLALRCVSKESSQRPSMAVVVKELTDAKHVPGSYSKQGNSGPSNS
uniref:non-specific serine/threonine protein kinase n=1 Tax=Leersia perrieri TaxID=77586 RepID=A0A0D9X8E9_9ORYZ